ncbi:hypothetical protein KDA_32270 [Dictyobacter alpinus]|uniref:Uncharacterized protein n=1 Tax=Dictyobacter alpinus TaxID=2014873 RepID=A0A402B8K6_9CHLR|nr:hypothetical protein [Dictyobacter alpinus]GCE27743.1 hypothetical protein KDA_32270 [Dictyobacter alpinus]
MQQSAKPQNTGATSLIITAITLFALSGAILGFAIGAFTHPRAPQQVANNNNNNNNKPAAKPTTAVKPTATPTPSVIAQPVGCPAMTTASNLDGMTFTVTLVVKNKVQGTCDPAKEPNMINDNVTCRIWLAKAKDDKHPVIENDEKLFNKPESFATPFPNEVPNGLVFSNGASQTQMCKQGQANWTVNLSPNLPKGKYFVVGLTNWGTYYNWSWSGLFDTSKNK